MAAPGTGQLEIVGGHQCIASEKGNAQQGLKPSASLGVADSADTDRAEQARAKNRWGPAAASLPAGGCPARCCLPTFAWWQGDHAEVEVLSRKLAAGRVRPAALTRCILLGREKQKQRRMEEQHKVGGLQAQLQQLQLEIGGGPPACAKRPGPPTADDSSPQSVLRSKTDGSGPMGGARSRACPTPSTSAVRDAQGTTLSGSPARWGTTTSTPPALSAGGVGCPVRASRY